MKKVVVTTLIVISMAVCAVASDRKGAALDRVETSSTILNQIMSAPDRAIPDGIMNGAKCIAIVPSDLKASFIIGANYGKGVATCRTEHGWSAPVFIVMNGGSFGFQAGGAFCDRQVVHEKDGPADDVRGKNAVEIFHRASASRRKISTSFVIFPRA